MDWESARKHCKEKDWQWSLELINQAQQEMEELEKKVKIGNYRGYMGAKGVTIIVGWNRIDKGLDKEYQVYVRSVDEVRVRSRTLSADEIAADI